MQGRGLSEYEFTCVCIGLHWGLVSKESACDAGNLRPIPESGRSPGGGHGNPLQYSCLENPMDRGAWWDTAHGVARAGHNLATEPHIG